MRNRRTNASEMAEAPHTGEWLLSAVATNDHSEDISRAVGSDTTPSGLTSTPYPFPHDAHIQDYYPDTASGLSP